MTNPALRSHLPEEQSTPQICKKKGGFLFAATVTNLGTHQVAKGSRGFLELKMTSRNVHFLDSTTQQKAGVWHIRLS